MSRASTLAIIFLITTKLFSAESISITLKEKPVDIEKDIYIYINADTPEYIIKATMKKNWSFIFFYNRANIQWIRHNIQRFKKLKTVYLFLNKKISSREKKQVAEISRALNYSLVIVQLSKDNVLQIPVHAMYQLYKINENFILSRNNKEEKAVMLSVTDRHDFFTSDTMISSGLMFEKERLYFLNIDDEKARNSISSSGRNLVFWKSEKNIANFIEKGR